MCRTVDCRFILNIYGTVSVYLSIYVFFLLCEIFALFLSVKMLFFVCEIMDRHKRRGVHRRGIRGWRICVGGFGIWLARRSRFDCISPYVVMDFEDCIRLLMFHICCSFLRVWLFSTSEL